MRKSTILTLLLTIALVAAACSDDDGDTPPAEDTTTEAPSSSSSSSQPPDTEGDGASEGSAIEAGMIVLSGQGNDLVAYDAEANRRLVIQNANDDPENGLDINAQICFLDDRTFIAGEDTEQATVPPGWGVFELTGDTFDELGAIQIGKLVPTYQPADSQAEMFGCGVLPDGRVVTSDVGNQASGDGTGQLMIWFPPFEGEPPYELGTPSYCKIDIAVTTAQAIAIDGEDVLLASARTPTLGVSRYTDLPTSVDECTDTDSTGAPMMADPNKELFIDVNGNIGLANGITASPNGWYVSGVFTGKIAEYGPDGTFIRYVLEPAEGDAPGEEPLPLGSPNGLATTADGTLWFADMALLVTPDSIGPGSGLGKVRMIRFDEAGDPQPPVVIDEGLAFPDALVVIP
ncbi:MAG: hypothetical protein IH940_11025 [Acidobacteria bacterium]|nr:hypothetical protein [Acidobacteriota bacterium]